MARKLSINEYREGRQRPVTPPGDSSRNNSHGGGRLRKPSPEEFAADLLAFERLELLSEINYEVVKRAAFALDQAIKGRKQAGRSPVRLTIDGQPQFHVLSFEPFEYEAYRPPESAPHISGSLALSRLVTAPHPVAIGGSLVYSAVQQAGETYCFRLDKVSQLDRIAEELDCPDVGFFTMIEPDIG